MPPKKIETAVVIEQPEHITLTESLIAQAMVKLDSKSSGATAASQPTAQQAAPGLLAAYSTSASGLPPPPLSATAGGHSGLSPTSGRTAGHHGAAHQHGHQQQQQQQAAAPTQQQLLQNHHPLCLAPNSSSASPAVEDLVASALGLADSYTVVPRDRDTVDYAVECIAFAASQQLSPRKALKLLHVLMEMRDFVHRGDVAGARQLLKNFASNEVAAYAREAAIQAAIAEAQQAGGLLDGTAASGFSPGGAQRDGGGGGNAANERGRGGAAGGGRNKHNKDADKDANAAAAQPALPAHAAFFSTADIGAVIDYAAFGLLQNWRLFQGAFLNRASGEEEATQVEQKQQRQQAEEPVIIFAPIVPPARPPPLRAARSRADWTADEAVRQEAVASELRRLQEAEREALALEAKEAAAVAATVERQRQEEEAAKLFFERHGTDLAVQHVQKELNDDIQARHNALLARLAKLEEVFKVSL